MRGESQRLGLSWANILWAFTLLALGSVMLRRWQDGVLPLYVHPAYEPLIVATAFGVIGLAGAQLWASLRSGAGGRGGHSAPLSWGVGLVAAAVMLAALAPARPLGSLVAAAQETQLADLPSVRPLSDETATWTLLEWAQALGGGVRQERVVGRPVSVVGFVHRPRQGARSGEFLVTRFVVRCCAADGFAVSLPVRHRDADALPLDSWVRVEGVLRLDTQTQPGAPFVEADAITPVAAPSTPYLSPT